MEENPKIESAIDPRHIGRVNDKEMPIDLAGMEMAKPGFADLRNRKHTVPMREAAPPSGEDRPSPSNPTS